MALVIAHEMAHQWFGDLVTMQWWDNIWLNEGFATWMENKPVAAMHPEWNIDQDVAAGEDDTLNIDAQPTTRAIRAKADTPDEIDQMFDGIAYGKAGDVLLTVENYLGEETFRQGVHDYLAAHQYANATAEDFWNAQTATSHKPVDKIMESLVAQPGEPLLTFGEPAGGKVTVAQKRFFLSPSIQPDPAQKWTLPVCFKTANGARTASSSLPPTPRCKLPTAGLFFANAGGKGYYRSAYPPSVYAALVASVETALTPAERISLIGDEWAQVRANKATVGDYLDLVRRVKADPNAEVVSSALGGVDCDRRAGGRNAGRESRARRLDSPHLCSGVRQARPALAAATRPIPASCAPSSSTSSATTARTPPSSPQAAPDRRKVLADPASVDPTLGQTALAIAARNGDAALFDKLQKVYETSTNPELQESGAAPARRV